jgi:hypothetical protein
VNVGGAPDMARVAARWWQPRKETAGRVFRDRDCAWFRRKGWTSAEQVAHYLMAAAPLAWRPRTTDDSTMC